MKKTTNSHSARTTLGVILFMLAIGLLCSIPFVSSPAQLLTGDAGSGHVGPAPGGPSASWSQVIVNNPGGVNNLATDDSSCVEGVNCEHFKLTVDGTTADWASQKVRVKITWQNPSDEYDIYIHRAADCSGDILTQANNGPGVTTQIADIDIASNGTGDYCVHVALNTVP